MAAPSIPNLNSLRSGRGRGRGRGSSSHGVSSEPSHAAEQRNHDKIVQQTDVDAAVSRLSAVQAGYLNDPYAKLFAKQNNAQKRFPIINRGTYVRTMAIDQLVETFLESNTSQKKQVISLGAGTDTRYFRMRSRYDVLEDLNWVYHEVDFAENTARKLVPIMKKEALAECVGAPVGYLGLSDPGIPDCIVDAPCYRVHSLDIRTLDPNKAPPSSFKDIDPSLPTIILSECCLCYLAPAAADTVVLYLTKHFFPSSTPLGMIIYEPIKPNDAFGKTMVSNLATRGIVLQTLKKYGSLEAQAARLQVYGFTDSRGADIHELWTKAIDDQEKERVAGLEMMDEVEEWELLAGHYCVAWGWKDGSEPGFIGNLGRWAASFNG